MTQNVMNVLKNLAQFYGTFSHRKQLATLAVPITAVLVTSGATHACSWCAFAAVAVAYYMANCSQTPSAK